MQGLLLLSKSFAVDQIDDGFLPQKVVLVLQVLELRISGTELRVSLGL